MSPMKRTERQDYVRPEADIYLFGVITARTIGVHQQCVRVSVADAATVVLTLPNVVEAVGKTYSVMITIAGGETGVITLTSGAECEDTAATWTLDATLDCILLYSDGRKWWPVVNEIA